MHAHVCMRMWVCAYHERLCLRVREYEGVCPCTRVYTLGCVHVWVDSFRMGRLTVVIAVQTYGTGI